MNKWKYFIFIIVTHIIVYRISELICLDYPDILLAINTVIIYLFANSKKDKINSNYGLNKIKTINIGIVIFVTILCIIDMMGIKLNNYLILFSIFSLRLGNVLIYTITKLNINNIKFNINSGKFNIFKFFQYQVFWSLDSFLLVYFLKHEYYKLNPNKES